ncbi:MAG: hypothetical protein M1812_004585 [Candelaria pacifica]|nr:MAG: hypothetical protein M1812_004585 [Candelaria pacifica]
MSKLLVIIGITGVQGSSVADVYLNEPNWRIRGLTRDVSRPAAKDWASKGIEMVPIDLDSISSLEEAFKGAHAIFAVTDFWGPMFDPSTAEKVKEGQSINEYCCELEIRRGKNIAIAAAGVEGLERLVFSGLTNVGERSKGKYTQVYHFDGKARIVEFVRAQVKALSGKMSVLIVGDYATNWRMVKMRRPLKQEDGSFMIMAPGDGDKPVPMVVTRKDTGYFVRALIQLPPGKTLLGYGMMISPKEYLKLWTEIHGVRNGGFRELTIKEAEDLEGGGPTAREAVESYAFTLEFGWDGGDPDVLRPEDLGVGCPTTSIEEYIREEDFSSIM